MQAKFQHTFRIVMTQTPFYDRFVIDNINNVITEKWSKSI